MHSGLGGTHTPDPGLHAQLLALEARASILEGASTLHWLAEELRAPALAAFRGGVWREAAQALEALHPDPAAVLRDLGVPFQAGLTRVSDALRLHHADPA
ncbi:hypothetical protein [Deinococcus aquaticus]|uniref:hypothetical protein n=1 Tax=Deinococcus aquaticus TaxID=328692 RepID=UPI00360B6999